MINGVQKKPYGKYILDSAIILGGAGAGLVCGMQKYEDNVVDVEKILCQKYLEYKKKVYHNQFNITDTFERQAKDALAKQKFGEDCDFAYNHLLKKLKIKNLAIGAFIGGAIGFIGVVAKKLYDKKKEQNANISNINANNK